MVFTAIWFIGPKKIISLSIIVGLLVAFSLNPLIAQEGQDIWNRPLSEPSAAPKAPPETKTETKKKVEKQPDAQTQKTVAEIVEEVDPSVVFIQVQLTILDPKDQKVKTGNLAGSGFFVSDRGYILTNAHVLYQKGYPVRKRRIIVKTLNGTMLEAALIKSDVETDLALLRIKKKNCKQAIIGDPHAIRVGEAVIAIGNPSGLEHSVTTGIISAVNRAKGRIQTSALTFHGNSGGPLFNMNGEVIGVIVSGLASLQKAGDSKIEVPVPGINFAIPINHANNLLQLVR